MNLLTAIVLERAKAVGYNPERDLNTIRRRHEAEGNGFLEIALPTLDDLLLEGLSSGRLPVITGWSLRKSTTLPAFLYGFWMRIFDHDGTLFPYPCIESIRSIRQISRTFKKVFEVCSNERVNTAIAGFEDTESELRLLALPPSLDAASMIAHQVFGSLVGRVMTGDARPKHGPGAVAERLDSVSKYSFDVVPERLTSLVGEEWFRPTWSELRDRPIIDGEIPARLVSVPKTATKPRLISIEPSYNQFIQQGFHALLKDELSRVSICSYKSQQPNQKLALKGSRDGSLATIDLSEASDRVHYELVQRLFAWNPAFIRMLDSTRSRTVELPDGRVLALSKFASMGSALTFPIEVMVFTTLVLLAVCTVERRYGRGFVKSLMSRRDIRVYGDDIIVPSKYYPTLVEILGEYGMKVNTSKSFSEGLFRESCGFDAYSGNEVTPVYVRRRIPRSKRDVSELVSLASFRNQWVSTYGYGAVQEWCDDAISAIIPFEAARPDGPDSDGILRRGEKDFPSNARWNRHLQRMEVKCMVPSHRRREVTATDSATLFKALYEDFQEDALHLTHHGRPVSAILKHRWVTV